MGRPRTCSCDECPKCVHRIYMRDYYYRNDRKTYVDVMRRRAYENMRYNTDLNFRARVKARVLLGQQVRRGIQGGGPCALCASPLTEGHHNDYAKPLEGTRLCKECHEMIHNSLPTF